MNYRHLPVMYIIRLLRFFTKCKRRACGSPRKPQREPHRNTRRVPYDAEGLIMTTHTNNTTPCIDFHTASTLQEHVAHLLTQSLCTSHLHISTPELTSCTTGINVTHVSRSSCGWPCENPQWPLMAMRTTCIDVGSEP